MPALNTDLYELTMAAGYFAAGKTKQIATFELTARRLPHQRNFLLAAGLQQAVEYLQNLRFEQDEVDYLRSLPQLRNAPPEFFRFLLDLRFTGDLFAMPEGTPVFPNEPIVIVRAPLVEAQLVETYLLSTIAFQTTIASKAIRCVTAAEGRSLVEFGSRRAHSPEAGVLAGRAAYLAGCAGTSNTQSGMKFGIPVFGTAAHAWTMSFTSEQEAFSQLQKVLGDATVFLIDTYDTLAGAKLAASLDQIGWGVRLDSGDLLFLSREVRRILDNAGWHSAKIFATNDLDEYRVSELVRAGAPIDSFGIGTQLSTSADAPALSAVYKLVELESDDAILYTAKLSTDKGTLPGAKQVYRCPIYDVIDLGTVCGTEANGEPLIRPVLIGGQLLETLPTTAKIRAHSQSAVSALPPELKSLDEVSPYTVKISSRLNKLTESVRERLQRMEAR